MAFIQAMLPLQMGAWPKCVKRLTVVKMSADIKHMLQGIFPAACLQEQLGSGLD
jgi:hypothetical protein